jgi:hypothetical protein
VKYNLLVALIQQCMNDLLLCYFAGQVAPRNDFELLPQTYISTTGPIPTTAHHV